jgi:hypothetical protein
MRCVGRSFILPLEFKFDSAIQMSGAISEGSHTATLRLESIGAKKWSGL